MSSYGSFLDELHVDRGSPHYDPLLLLIKLSLTSRPAIREVRIGYPSLVRTAKRHRKPMWKSSATATFISYTWTESIRKVHAQANTAQKAYIAVQEAMLAELRKEEYTRQYYLDVPSFFDHLEIAEFWPPLAKDPKFMMRFIKACKTESQPSTIKQWKKKMRESREKRDKTFHFSEG
ncbi:uncharacterized protein LY89DRAFT_664670 [Mollisia scopiformis]|uniref:Uncharacterized protein n=1 Tax=Mollisia scopiformis TaxID=149040 RepID=A0A194XS67_MOLSC|nr:uncharacterized protein LY89DRAFT_664670 [Mollisia scopiformis]KUJ22889.1 hypothetical protein LY89DRAFT_664670 [Mollisia scopiformis]